MVDDIILDDELQKQGNDVGYRIIPGKTCRQRVKYKQENDREEIRHVLEHRVILVRRHTHAVDRDQETRDYRSDRK